MTDQHPLTDDKCYELWSGNLYENDKMRAAADWQFEQVIEWLEDHIFEYMYEDGYFHQYKCFEDLKKAMRPTTPTETP